MNAYRVKTVVLENGKVMLQGLPFQVGKAVEVIVFERADGQENPQPSEKSGFSTSKLTDEAYLEGVSSLMSEWESDADEQAYEDL